MRSITGLLVGMSVVAVSAIGGALAQSRVEGPPAMSQDAVVSGYESPLDGTARLSDHQQLKTYFLNGSRDRQR